LNEGAHWVAHSSATTPRRRVIDIVELAKRHGALLERILARSTGAIGEILFADALAALVYQVRPTNNKARQSDLLVTFPEGASFSVEVKSDRSKRPTWFVRECPNPAVSDFWCFVSAPRSATALPDLACAEIFVLTAAEVCAVGMSQNGIESTP
jgi:hypothetical protein